MMATTKIWPVKNHLKRVLDYTSNPEKTDTLDDIDFQFNGLSQSIHYTTQDMKTESNYMLLESTLIFPLPLRIWS